MRVRLAQGAAVALTIAGLTGCQSGPGSSTGRGWWAKNKAPASSALANAPAGPQLPSTTAAAPTAQQYGGLPPGAPGTQPGYAEQPAGYPTTNYPDTHAAAAGYAGAAAQPSAAQPNAAMPATTANTALPQNGPYNSVYGQGAAPAGTVPATAAAYSAGAYQAPPAATADPYAAPANNAYSAPANNAYAAPPANTGAAYGSAPADPNYAAGAGGAAAHTADTRSRTDYGAPADSYPTTGGAPPAATSAGSERMDYQYSDPRRAVEAPADTQYNAPAGAGYGAPAQGGAATAPNSYPAGGGYPGRSDTSMGDRYPNAEYSHSDAAYSPGDTGYRPSGVAPYQNSAAPASTTAPAERREPAFRPGSTSDYAPLRGARNSAGDSQGARSAVTPAGYETRGADGAAPTASGASYNAPAPAANASYQPSGGYGSPANYAAPTGFRTAGGNDSSTIIR